MSMSISVRLLVLLRTSETARIITTGGISDKRKRKKVSNLRPLGETKRQSVLHYMQRNSGYMLSNRHKLLSETLF